MPFIDYYLTSDIEITKDKLSETELTRKLLKNVDLGSDNRTWNRKQLKALKLLLCNAITYMNEDNGVFLYSRKKRQIPTQFNPLDIAYSSLFFVIDKLVEGKVITGIKAPPRTKGTNPKKLSEFKVTQDLVDLAISLGINKTTVRTIANFHVRLRDTVTNENLEFKHNEYTRHVEMLMSEYCHYLNQHNILFSTEDYDLETEEGLKDWGARGQKIHLYRNYKNYSDKENHKESLSKFYFVDVQIDFLLGGRSGGYWQGKKPDDRQHILIDGKEVGTADFPCMHLNLCYRQETNDWYQKETYKELKAEGREREDAYIVSEKIHRDIAKKMVQLMFNIKGRRAVSKTFNTWLKEEADIKLVIAHKKSRYTNIEIMELIERKHHTIIDYFYKGVVAGQIIQWEEANLLHEIANNFQKGYDFPCLTIYDELIVPKEELAMVKDFMFSSGHNEMYSKMSLMNQIKSM
ncbi:hypothetical protein M9C83_02815 [SAR86 cluster bacterium]|nr:hypothetical protein M9C83_02815 [SAR86 cluster bacterium]